MYLLANVGEAFGSLVGNGYKRDAKSVRYLLDASNLPMYETRSQLWQRITPVYGWLAEQR